MKPNSNPFRFPFFKEGNIFNISLTPRKRRAREDLFSELLSRYASNSKTVALIALRVAWLLSVLACLLILWREPIAAEIEPNLTGKLLVATEEISDPRFVETVIYMVKHNSEGALGLVINRPLAKGPIDDLLKGFGAETKGSKREVMIHYGGPVNTTQGFVLHSDDVILESTTKVKDGLAMTSDIEIFQAIAAGKGPKQYLIILGYAGWAPGQLEAEIKDDGWFVIPVDKSLIFGKDAEKKWPQAVQRRQTPA